MIKIPRKDFIKEHKHLIKLLESFKGSKKAKAEAKSQSKELGEIVGSGDLSKTDYADKYPKDVLRILEKMTFDDGLLLVGSASLRSQIYAGDVDGYEVVERDEASDMKALTSLAKQFRAMVADIRRTDDLYIADIKSGAIPEWEILSPDAHIKDGKVVGYDQEASLAKVKLLAENKILSPAEATQVRELLKRRPTVADFLRAKEELKYHIIRWSALEIADNKKVLRDGRTVSLEQTFSMPALTKLDCVGLVQRSRYTDFSVIYEFKNNGRTLNPVKSDIADSLAEDIEAYKAKGNFFKALKRTFALAKFKDNEKEMNRLTELLNGDMGRLYQIVGDIGTLISIIDKAPLKNVRYEIDQFKSRLSNVWELKSYLKAEPSILSDLKRLEEAPREAMEPMLERIGDRIDDLLQAEAKKHI
jgi:hypothetical protein